MNPIEDSGWMTSSLGRCSLPKLLWTDLLWSSSLSSSYQAHLMSAHEMNRCTKQPMQSFSGFLDDKLQPTSRACRNGNMTKFADGKCRRLQWASIATWSIIVSGDGRLVTHNCMRRPSIISYGLCHYHQRLLRCVFLHFWRSFIFVVSLVSSCPLICFQVHYTQLGYTEMVARQLFVKYSAYCRYKAKFERKIRTN